MSYLNSLQAQVPIDSNRKERAYRIIKEKIISCQLPPGSILNERELVEEIGTSRTPIREALHRLEKENLVLIIPQRGAFVCEITPKIINDIYQLREIIEPNLVSMVTPKIAEDVLLRFKQEFLTLGKDDYNILAKRDNEFHFTVIDLVGNECLKQVMENMYDQNERIRFLLTRLPQRLQETVAEHVDIIDHMLARDQERAAEAMRRHLVQSRHAAFRI
jgi:DNA-binding GntR family transcriptional regulator